MLKLRIDKDTGKVLSAYPETFNVPEPYVEISEDDNSAMSEDSEYVYFYKKKKFTKVLKAELEAIEKRKAEIQAELASLDTKRIRAVCEPSVKDESTGETWLEYYNSEIEKLRTEYNSL
jgi:hypothetical protein